ncbi:hypothetical protein D3C76_564220 [compost metagenome]
MFHGGHGGDVRRTAQARFVGEHATFHAHDDGAAEQAAECRVEAEGALEDGFQHGWHVFDLGADHVQGHADVGQGLDRYQQVRHRGDALDAADEGDGQQHCQDDTSVARVEGKGVLQRVGHGVRLQADEGEAVGDQQQDREHDGHAFQLQAVLDVVGRATTVQAVAIGALVDLGQGAFEEAAGHADQGSDPHPEHRAWAAQGHGDTDTGDVTGANAAGQAQHQGLERAQLACLAMQ